VNDILDLLEEGEIDNVDLITVNPPEGDDSDGYDNSDTEEGAPHSLSRNLLRVSKNFCVCSRFFL